MPLLLIYHHWRVTMDGIDSTSTHHSKLAVGSSDLASWAKAAMDLWVLLAHDDVIG